VDNHLDPDAVGIRARRVEAAGRRSRCEGQKHLTGSGYIVRIARFDCNGPYFLPLMAH
jgi:hypothetical protein